MFAHWVAIIDEKMPVIDPAPGTSSSSSSQQLDLLNEQLGLFTHRYDTYLCPRQKRLSPVCIQTYRNPGTEGVLDLTVYRYEPAPDLT